MAEYVLDLQLEEDRNYCPEKWQKTCWKYKREDGRNKRTERNSGGSAVRTGFCLISNEWKYIKYILKNQNKW